MSKFRYLLKEGFRSIWVNRLMSMASIGVLFSCLLLIGAAVLLSLNINEGIISIEQENVIKVYLADIDDAGIQSVENQIYAISNVKECEFVSKEEGLRDVLNNMDADTKSFFDYINNDNPLPDGFSVTVKDNAEFNETVRDIEKITNVIRTHSRTDLSNKLVGIRQILTIAGVAIIAILFIISLFIISNTIKLTMYSRKLEINIMKAVGATDKFVRTPFLMEGIILGTISGLLAIGTLYYLYEAAIAYIDIDVFGDNFAFVQFSDFALWMGIAFVVIGILAGVFGSTFSIRKYLRKEGSEFSAI